jgi:hypothetical protein
MCTVTLIARRRGYALGMNRDEKRARVAGLPPARRQFDGRVVVCPSEPGGGTWIGVNEAGITLALINWYSVKAKAPAPAVSRGGAVWSALSSTSPGAVDAAIRMQPLPRINPFRLIGVFPNTREVVEWQWDLLQFARRLHPWRTGVWISSGYDESGAQQSRGRAFAQALKQASAGTLEWLRRLHRSHAPGRGPYSVCMHRADAATVSYTEVVVNPAAATLRYASGPPCCGKFTAAHEFTLSVDPILCPAPAAR